MKVVKKLLIIDDDDVFIFLARKAVEKTNLVEFIQVLGNGLDAINFLKENHDNVSSLPDIILLDISMPVMDGWQFLDQFTELIPIIQKKISIYICSSSISPNDVLLAKNNDSVSDYIIKPVTKEKIIDLINREKNVIESVF